MEGEQKPRRSLRKRNTKSQQKPPIQQPNPQKKAPQARKLKSRVSLIEEELQLKQKKPSKKEMKLEKFTNFREFTRPREGRIYRALTQRMYLLKAEQIEDDEWTFSVLGSRGVAYTLEMTETDFTCQCHDFATNGGVPCKHLYFIVFRVAQVNSLYEKIESTTRISPKDFPIISSHLKARLKPRLSSVVSSEKNSQDVDLGDDTDCAICYEQFKKASADLFQCPQCKKYFHIDCINAWKTKNSTCPLCRKDLTLTRDIPQLQGDMDEKDPLCLLKKVKLCEKQ